MIERPSRAPPHASQAGWATAASGSRFFTLALRVWQREGKEGKEG